MAPFAGYENRSDQGGRPAYVSYSFVMLAALNIALSITALIGNILIQVVIPKVSSLHPPSKLLYRCLAFTDLCVGLIVHPIFATFLIRLSAEDNKLWDFTSPTAVSAYVTGSILGGVSLFTITTISIDRLLTLLLILRYRQVVTLRRVRAFVVLLCLMSSVFGVLYFWKRVLFFYSLMIGITLCLIVSTVCYTKIYVTLRHYQVQVQTQDHLHQGKANGSTGGVPMNIARYRKTVSTALCVYLAMVACYLPQVIVAIFWIERGESPSLSVISAAFLSLLLFNSSLNPVLYCWRIREVRQAVKETIRRFCC